jgi:hypothetical protein
MAGELQIRLNGFPNGIDDLETNIAYGQQCQYFMLSSAKKSVAKG